MAVHIQAKLVLFIFHWNIRNAERRILQISAARSPTLLGGVHTPQSAAAVPHKLGTSDRPASSPAVSLPRTAGLSDKLLEFLLICPARAATLLH